MLVMDQPHLQTNTDTERHDFKLIEMTQVKIMQNFSKRKDVGIYRCTDEKADKEKPSKRCHVSRRGCVDRGDE